MILQLVLLGTFILAAVYGAIQSVSSIRKMRAARKYKDAIFAWSERNTAGYEYELLAWISTSIHWLAVILIGAIVLVMIFFATFDPQALLTVPQVSLFCVLMLVEVASAAAGSLWGSLLFGPLAELMGGRRNYAISPEGLCFGGRLFPWKTFSHLSLEPERRVLYLWSASLPETTAFALLQDTPQQLEVLRSTIQQYVPSGEPPSSGSLRQYVLPLIMLALSLPFVAIALLLTLAPFIIALLATCVLMFILVFAGGQLLMRLVYGGQGHPAPLE